MQKITPFLWFSENAEEAMNFYVSVFSKAGKDAKVVSIHRYPEGPLEGPMKGMQGKVLTGIFELAGQEFMALDGGPIFKFNESISFMVSVKTKKKLIIFGKHFQQLPNPNNAAGLKTNMAFPGK